MWLQNKSIFQGAFGPKVNVNSPYFVSMTLLLYCLHPTCPSFELLVILQVPSQRVDWFFFHLVHGTLTYLSLSRASVCCYLEFYIFIQDSVNLFDIIS